MEIETSKGVLKYKMPSVSECFDILDCLAVGKDEKFSLMMLKKKIIERTAEKLIDHESVGYQSTTEMFNDAENMALPLSEIADKYYLCATKAFEKKS